MIKAGNVHEDARADQERHEDVHQARPRLTRVHGSGGRIVVPVR